MRPHTLQDSALHTGVALLTDQPIGKAGVKKAPNTMVLLTCSQMSGSVCSFIDGDPHLHTDCAGGGRIPPGWQLLPPGQSGGLTSAQKAQGQNLGVAPAVLVSSLLRSTGYSYSFGPGISGAAFLPASFRVARGFAID